MCYSASLNPGKITTQAEAEKAKGSGSEKQRGRSSQAGR